VLTLLISLILLTLLTLLNLLILIHTLIHLPRSDLGERDLARLMASVPSPANLLVMRFTVS
jgi:hypothetical protein